MSTIKVNTITKRSGSTLTIGECGATVQLATGATQTGFGRTGTVDWCTTAKTSPFTAVSGKGYFVNTTSGGVTVTLPASPSAGDIVAVRDYAKTFKTNNLTFCRNSESMDGETFNLVLNTKGIATTLVYVDATKGWQSVNSNSPETVNQAQYIQATGGTVTTCGDFKIHTFTSDSAFCVSATGNPAGSTAVDYLVVAGGGAGAEFIAGGGGAGGFRVSNSYSIPAPTMSPLANPTGITVTAQSYPITVGAGGSTVPGPTSTRGTSRQGANSVFSTITSAGGGGGAGFGNADPAEPGVPRYSGARGGSGGGACYNCGPSPTCGTNSGGTGNFPPVSPPQGNPGGSGQYSPTLPDPGNNFGDGGGGGAGAAGGNFTSPGIAGPGGIGSFVAPSFAVSCAGTPGPVGSVRYFAGGGGAGTGRPAHTVGTGGSGGGGAGGGPGGCVNATAGGTNTGGGGGGAGGYPSPGTSAAGGSGIVILRYKFQN